MGKRSWIQLDEPIPLETTRGYGYAHFIIDLGSEHNLQWVTLISDPPHTGEWWTLDNSEVRGTKNSTLQRGYAKRLKKHG